MQSTLVGEVPVAGSGASEGQRGGTYRAALAAVIILSVFFVAGVVALIFGFMHQYQIYSSGKHTGPSAVAGTMPATIMLEPGARILSVLATSNQLVLHLATPQGNQVEVLDLATGKFLYRVAAPTP